MTIPPGAMQAAGKIITSCWKIYSVWKERATKAEQAELEKIIEDLQAGKTLGRQVGENLSRSLQSLRLSPSTLETLRLLDADPIFHVSAAECLLAGNLSAPELARLLQESSLGASCPAPEIESVAALWLDAIDQTIGGSGSLSHALQFKSDRRIHSAVLDISDKTEEIVTETREIRRTQEIGNSVGFENLALNRDMHKMLRELVERGAVPEQPTKAQSVLQKRLQSQFEKCLEHLRFGSIDVAEKEFVDLIADLVEAGEVGSSDLLFRCHLNHSSCLLLKERTSDAKEALERARQIYPDDNRYLRHYAMLLSYDGKNQDALEIVQRLRVLEPNEPKNLADEIALLHDLNQNDELAKLVDSVDIEDADVQCHKAHALLKLGKYEESVGAARRAAQIKPELEGPWIALAYAIGFPVVSRWENGEQSQLCIVGEDAVRLSEAIEAALKAEAILHKRSRKALLEEVQANLLAFYTLLYRYDEGLLLAMKMGVSSEMSEVVLGNLYHIFLLNGKREKAVVVANEIAIKLGTEQSKINKANALVLAGEGKLALKELAELKSANEGIVDNTAWMAVASAAHYALHQSDEALNILQRGVNAHPESAELQMETAKLMAEMRREDQALGYFRRAENLSPKDPEILSCFGQFLYFNRDWAGALERFEKIGARSPHNPLFPRFVTSLYYADRLDDCLDCVRDLRSARSEVDETVFGVGSRAAMILDEWPLAKELLESLVRGGVSRNFENLKLLAKVYLRLDDHQEAYTLLSQAVPEDSKDVEALTLLAQVCAACGKHSEALQRHAISIEADPASIQARAAFFGTMLTLPDGFDPTPETLQLHHENIPILAADPSGVLRTIKVQRDDGEFDFSNIQRELDKNAKAVAEVLEYSSQNPMPLQFLASDLGVKMFEGWRAFTADSERGVRMCSGTKEEQDSQLCATDVIRTVSVDLVALFTLQGLGQLGLLNRLFDKVFIHISILDAVVQELREAVAWPSSGRLGSVNGQMIMTPPQPEERERKIRALTEIRDFLKGDQIVLSGLRSTTKFANFVPDIVCNSRVQGFMEPALVAHEQKAALLSDDFIQRVLSSRLTCPTFCTQALLRRALIKRIFSQSEYQDAVLTLHSWNYHFVSDNQGTLLRLVERERVPTSALAQKVLINLIRHSISSGESRRILLGFVLCLWAKRGQGDFAARPWIAAVWDLIEQAEPNLKLALRMITDLPAHSPMDPRLFSLFVSFVCEVRSGEPWKAHKLLNHGVSVANRIARISFKSGKLHTKYAWEIEAQALEILKMLTAHSSGRR
jgi:tetratricopeptide (TPR) repeat protein